MMDFIRELFPLPRSITGDGLRETLRRIGQELPLTIHEVPTGTRVLDWEIPREWNIREARIETMDGRTIVDFHDSNLHVISYSAPVDRIISRKELARHIHTLPDKPDVIPYRKGYSGDDWAFCLPHSTWQAMQDIAYRVKIESEFSVGALSYGELLIPGQTNDEFLVSVHCCHPSLANDNLSGIAVATALAKRLVARASRLSFRFLFIPTTFGSLAWLATNEAKLPNIRHGLVLTCVGDPAAIHYKLSRDGRAPIDRAVALILAERGTSGSILPFRPDGCDERQYCSPGYNLPVGCLMRSPDGTFPEYHTSADNLDFVKEDALQDTLDVLQDVVDLLEADLVYVRRDGRGEPRLGRLGLYEPVVGKEAGRYDAQLALQWVLNLADGHHTFLDMVERSGMSVRQMTAAVRAGLSVDLIAASHASAF